MLKYKSKKVQDGFKNAIKIVAILENISDLEGKVLTIIDASIADNTQRKAIKDLIYQTFGSKVNWICKLGNMDINKAEIDETHVLVPVE